VRLLYFDCIAGISGDMALGALVDAGVDGEELRATLGTLPLEPFGVEFEVVDSGGIGATRAIVSCEDVGIIRTYASIRALLDETKLPDDARHLAQRIFHRLAEAEARVHRKEIETVTFHEVGAVDSIVDIVGTALALTMLGVERVFASPVPTGMGMTKTEHGLMPIPAPAVVELLRGVPMHSKGVPTELVTPTGAAILATVVEGYGDLPPMRTDAVGYGAGTHVLGFPNVLRVLVGDDAADTSGEPEGSPTEVVLETNVDDLSPELQSYAIERLLDAGAQDAWVTPIVMKKGRAAVTISVLCSSQRADELRRVLFRETGTLGVRTAAVQKRALERETIEVLTAAGVVHVKIGRLAGEAITVAPEFEDCARAAREAGIPARDVFEQAIRKAREELAGPAGL
jgi:uncharacterized protein (TIGR00299 family) protein